MVLTALRYMNYTNKYITSPRKTSQLNSKSEEGGGCNKQDQFLLYKEHWHNVRKPAKNALTNILTCSTALSAVHLLAIGLSTAHVVTVPTKYGLIGSYFDWCYSEGYSNNHKQLLSHALLHTQTRFGLVPRLNYFKRLTVFEMSNVPFSKNWELEVTS